MPAALPRLTYPSEVGLAPAPLLAALGHFARHQTQVNWAAHRRPVKRDQGSVLIEERHSEQRTLPKAFRVQRVSAFLAEHQLVLRNAMHALITDWTAILGSWNAPP